MTPLKKCAHSALKRDLTIMVKNANNVLLTSITIKQLSSANNVQVGETISNNKKNVNALKIYSGMMKSVSSVISLDISTILIKNV